MKIRMRQNSVRLRLTRSEVTLFEETGHLEECVRFPSGALRYILDRSATESETRADFVNCRLTVTVPQAAADRWTSTQAVGIEAHSDGLDILIEKDFQCAHGPVDHDSFSPPECEREASAEPAKLDPKSFGRL